MHICMYIYLTKQIFPAVSVSILYSKIVYSHPGVYKSTLSVHCQEDVGSRISYTVVWQSLWHDGLELIPWPYLPSFYTKKVLATRVIRSLSTSLTCPGLESWFLRRCVQMSSFTSSFAQSFILLTFDPSLGSRHAQNGLAHLLVSPPSSSQGCWTLLPLPHRVRHQLHREQASLIFFS